MADGQFDDALKHPNELEFSQEDSEDSDEVWDDNVLFTNINDEDWEIAEKGNICLLRGYAQYLNTCRFHETVQPLKTTCCGSHRHRSHSSRDRFTVIEWNFWSQAIYSSTSFESSKSCSLFVRFTKDLRPTGRSIQVLGTYCTNRPAVHYDGNRYR